MLSSHRGIPESDASRALSRSTDLVSGFLASSCHDASMDWAHT